MGVFWFWLCVFLEERVCERLRTRKAEVGSLESSVLAGAREEEGTFFDAISVPSWVEREDMCRVYDLRDLARPITYVVEGVM